MRRGMGGGGGGQSVMQSLGGGAGELFPTRALCIKVITLRESRIRMSRFK